MHHINFQIKRIRSRKKTARNLSNNHEQKKQTKKGRKSKEITGDSIAASSMHECMTMKPLRFSWHLYRKPYARVTFQCQRPSFGFEKTGTKSLRPIFQCSVKCPKSSIECNERVISQVRQPLHQAVKQPSLLFCNYKLISLFWKQKGFLSLKFSKILTKEVL